MRGEEIAQIEHTIGKRQNKGLNQLKFQAQRAA
jgi:hypothetical protein